MRVAIFGGTGPEGKGLALHWASAGEEILIGSRQAERARATGAELNARLGQDLLRGGTNEEVAEAAEVIVVSVPFEGHRSLLTRLAPRLQKKIVIDVAIPLGPGFPPAHVPPPEGSAAEEARAVLGTEIHLAAAFQNVSAHGLNRWPEPLRGDVLVCGDDPPAKEAALYLTGRLGFRGLDAGPLTNARHVEGLTVLLLHLNHGYGTKSVGIQVTEIDDSRKRRIGR